MTDQPTTTLAAHIAWLESIGQAPGCTCRWAWKGLGRLYGTSLGKGWVRMNTARDCPAHGPGRRKPAVKPTTSTMIAPDTERKPMASDLTMEVRGHDFTVEVQGGHFQTVHNGQVYSDPTWEGLRDRLMRATKVAAAKVEIEFVTMKGGKPERGIVTGIHQSNHNLLVTWPERTGRAQKDQLAGYNLKPSLFPMEHDELLEWVRLQGEAHDARDRLKVWEDERAIDLRKAVDAAIDNAVEAME